MVMIYPPPPPTVFANFRILDYIEYEKPGKYGDEKFDTHGFEMAKQPPEVQDAVNALTPGDIVKLGWQHDYVTASSDGGKTSAKYPERPVFLLEKAPMMVLTVESQQTPNGTVEYVLNTMAGNVATTLLFESEASVTDIRNAAAEQLGVHPMTLEFVGPDGLPMQEEDAGAAAAVPTSVQPFTIAPMPRLRMAPMTTAAAPMMMTPAPMVTTAAPAADHSQGRWFAAGEALPPGYVAMPHPEGHVQPQPGHALSPMASQSFIASGSFGVPATAPATEASKDIAADGAKAKKKSSKKKKTKGCC
eukprot:TRINITY_DN8879_c0_g1_i1.p1 TRINITY_DN8879_c0_g1~~TRINITY_DN8879_c0_g1_i1.p1  ORF type:complete len:348 (+),score=98.97 TRINITY_DN8879_c0_g1_i1:138-1046(+)